MDSFNCSNFVFILYKPHSTPNCTCPWSGHLLAMTKPSCGICPIAMGETLYRFTSHVLCFQFHETFTTYFSSHQFGIATKGGCETIIHAIKCTSDLHPNQVVFQLDVANAFNSLLRRVIFQELCVACGDITQLILFISAF